VFSPNSSAKLFQPLLARYFSAPGYPAPPAAFNKHLIDHSNHLLLFFSSYKAQDVVTIKLNTIQVAVRHKSQAQFFGSFSLRPSVHSL
jgi:hypothetical protein